MKPGPIQLGPATCRLAYSQLVPGNLRGKLREVASLVVEQASRGRGAATALMDAIIEQADGAGVSLLVVVEPFDDEPVSAARLRDWYEKLGFIEIQVMPCVMVRSPRQFDD